MRKIGFAMALAASLAGGPAMADTIALTDFSGGFLTTSGDDQLYGWFFDLSAPVDVTALGVGDSRGAALAVSHDVGIFAVSNQTLLVSATVPAGSGETLLDGFRYVSVSPTILPAGAYVIVMTMPEGNADSQSNNNTSETTSSPVTYVDSAFDEGSSLRLSDGGRTIRERVVRSKLHLCHRSRDSGDLNLGDAAAWVRRTRLCGLSQNERAAHRIKRAARKASFLSRAPVRRFCL